MAAVLGIGSSCDETAAAVYDIDRGLLSHQLYSQVTTHADFGGVVPELAARDHVRKLPVLIERALAEAGLTASTSEAIRMVRQGAVRIAGERLEDPKSVLVAGTDAVIQVGKRRVARVVLVAAA